jgi:hypothetical protein
MSRGQESIGDDLFDDRVRRWSASAASTGSGEPVKIA